MKQSLLILLFIVHFQSKAQNVIFPDVKFKEYLLNNANINLNSDSEIQLSEAQNVTYINVGHPYGTPNSDRISSLEGLQSFVNLVTLKCENNLLTTIDIVQNNSLVELDCSFNGISNINISQNINLEKLYCTKNIITTI